VAADVESARRDWEEGYRRLREESRDPAASDRLYRQLGVVTDELRKRVGGTFTLADLAAAYADADRWALEAVAEREAAPGWPATVTVAGDAAFHLYARGAVDYEP
jgi:glutathione S-transferase